MSKMKGVMGPKLGPMNVLDEYNFPHCTVQVALRNGIRYGRIKYNDGLITSWKPSFIADQWMAMKFADEDYKSTECSTDAAVVYAQVKELMEEAMLKEKMEHEEVTLVLMLDGSLKEWEDLDDLLDCS